MASLVLPPGTRELFDRTRAVLGAHLGGDHHLCLGGGTALAARWHHRRTTDLDYFIEPKPYRSLYENQQRFKEELEAATGGRCQFFSVSHRAARIYLADNSEISIGTPLPITDNPRSADTVHGTSVGMETNAEILAKKIGGRILANNTFVPRDLYDLAVAKHYDLDAAITARGCFSDGQLEDIRKELGNLPRDWMETHPQPVVAPARPGAARDAVAAVRQFLDTSRSRRWTR